MSYFTYADYAAARRAEGCLRHRISPSARDDGCQSQDDNIAHGRFDDGLSLTCFSRCQDALAVFSDVSRGGIDCFRLPPTLPHAGRHHDSRIGKILRCAFDAGMLVALACVFAPP